MLDTLIVGGGVCGLSLATKLQSAGQDYMLIEARERLGGRVETLPETSTAVSADLGPSWFWPATQPRITRLIADLGLSNFPQHDNGTILHLGKADGNPEAMAQSSVHIGARCVGGGMDTLVKALSQPLAPERLRLGYVLHKLVLCGDHIEAYCQHGSESLVIQAQHVVLALPPRLVIEGIAFEPALNDALGETLKGTPTWMAAQCKAVSRFDTPFWRASGLAGNAFVTHAQAVLGEIFDASGENGLPAALGGFSALPAALRNAIGKVHELMIHSQYAQLFGPAAAQGDLHVRDWAQERFTCSALDLAEPSAHPQDGVALLAEPLWDGRLFLGSSETAAQSAGYLEGALDAAARIWKELSDGTRGTEKTMCPELHANKASLEKFTDAVAELRTQALSKYILGIARALSSQQNEDVTQVVLIEVAAQTYAQALDFLKELPLDLDQARIENGRVSLTPPLLAAFLGFANDLLKDAQDHNAKSCAISNFPLEHNLNQAYLQAIRRDLAALWREFALSVNDELLDRLEESTPAG